MSEEVYPQYLSLSLMFKYCKYLKRITAPLHHTCDFAGTVPRNPPASRIIAGANRRSLLESN
jgi:hypothetical protein